MSLRVNFYVLGMIIHKMVIAKELIGIRIHFTFQFRSTLHNLLVQIVNFNVIFKDFTSEIKLKDRAALSVAGFG